LTRLGYAALMVLSLGVAAYAFAAYGFRPLGAFVHPDMFFVNDAATTEIYTHVFASAVALALGPFQFSLRLRRARPGLHRWLGRLYLGVGVLPGGLSGLVMAFHAYGGIAARAGFAVLALLWLYTALCAFAAIRGRDVAAHRRWMVRNFALTFAAVTLRLYLPSAMAARIPFELAYPAIAWLCWIPNLIVAEWLLRRTPSAIPTETHTRPRQTGA
jgi:uncharacterized membrane protein